MSIAYIRLSRVLLKIRKNTHRYRKLLLVSHVDGFVYQELGISSDCRQYGCCGGTAWPVIFRQGAHPKLIR